MTGQSPDAVATASIPANRQKVWEALTDPALI
jgi:uncharacterized protein YndB with AHSA1/START domain